MFTPSAGAPGSTATTNFRIGVASGTGTQSGIVQIYDSTTTVIDTDPVATTITIKGTVAGQTPTPGAPIKPFSGVTITDTDTGEIEKVYVGVVSAGTLADGTGFTGLTPVDDPDLNLPAYSITGSAAAITAELDALVFTPSAGAPNSTVTTSFSITVDGSDRNSAYDLNTSVINTYLASAPTITGTVAGQATMSEASVKPFSGVTIADGNAGATETLTITVGGSGGTLTDGAGFSKLTAGGTGVYTLSGTAAAVTSELDALVFKPTAAAPNSTATATFKLVDTSSVGTSASDTATTVIDRNPFGPDVGTLYTPPAGSDTLACDGTYPFDSTVTGQHTITFQAGVDSNVQVDVSNYGSRSYNDIFKYARADGNVSIRDTSGASDILEFVDLKSTDVTFDAVYSTYENSGQGWSSLAITVTSTGKTVILDNWNRTDFPYGPQTLIFADGVSLARSQVLATEQNQAPSAAQYRFDGAYTTTHLTGQYGGAPVADVWFDTNNDTVYASSGVNTYHYASTGGSDQIFDTSAQKGVLSLTDLNASNVTLSRTGTSLTDLLVKINATGKTIDVAGQFANQGISSIVFANATSMTAAQIASATALTPTITGTVAGQATTSEATVKPFSGVTIADPNANSTETLTITVGGVGGALTDGAGFSALKTTSTAGVYTLSGTAAAVTSELDALVFKPTAGAPNTSSTSTFKLVDASSAGTTITDVVTTVVDTDPAVAPTITGTVANQATTSEATVKPFSGVTIADPNANSTETLTITVGGTGGTLTDGSGFSALKTTSTAGVYTLSGTAAAVTSELDALMFKPTAGAPNSTSTSTFKLVDATGAGTSVTNTTTTVIDTDPAVAPTITGTVAGQATTSEATVKLFSSVTIADPNANSTETLTITVGGNGGTLTDGSGFSALKTTSTAGVYTLSGIAAAVTSELDALVFKPTAGAPKTSSTSTFKLADASSAGTSATDTTTTVVNTDPAPAPTITGAVAGQATNSEATVKPFSKVTIADPNTGSTETLTITVGGVGGTLTDGSGFSALKTTSTAGVYTLSGTAAAVTSELDALVFKPTAGAPNSTSTSTFKLADASSAGSNATDTTTTVIDTDPAVAPTITGTVANQATTSEAAVKPFSGVTIADPNANSTETLTITVGGVGGTLTDGSGFSNLKTTSTAGVYTLSGTAAAVTSELDALMFKPTAGTPNTSSTSTFKLVDATSAGTSVTNTTTTVINTDPSQTIVIQNTNGTWATVNVNSGTISLINAQAAIHGSGNTIGTDTNGDTFGLYDTTGAPDTVNGSNNLIYLNNAQTGVVGGNNTIVFDTSGKDVAVLSGTNGNWDTVQGSNGTISLNNAQAGVYGGGNTINLDANGDILGLYNTSGTADTVNGSNSTIYVNNAQTKVVGGNNVISFDTSSGDAAVLSSTNGNWDTVYGKNDTISLNNARAGIYGGGNTINLDANGDIFGIYNTGGTADTVNGSNSTIYVNNAQTKVIGGNNVISFDTSSGDAAVLSSTNGNWDTVYGANDTISLNNAQAGIYGGGNTINLDVNGDVFGIYNTNGTSDTINGSNSTIYVNKAQASIVGKSNSVYVEGQVSIQGDSNTIYGSASNTVTVLGQSNSIYEGSGVTTVNISDLGHALGIAIGTSTQNNTISGFGTTDTTGVIHFQNGAGGFANVNSVLSALHSDGNGGTMLSLGSSGSIDFKNTAQSNLHAANFAIG